MAARFSDFYRSEYPRLAGSLRLATNDEAQAEELAQEAFTRALNHWDRVAELDRPAGWVYRTGFNLLRRSWKRSQLEGKASTNELAEHAQGDGERLDVAAALARLPEAQRTAVVMRHILDYSTDEVAAILNLKPEAVRSLLYRGVRTLRAHGNLSLKEED